MKKCIKLLILIVILILVNLCVFLRIKFCRINNVIELMKRNSEIDNYYFENKNMIKKRYKNVVVVILGGDTNLYYYYDFGIQKYYIIDNDNKVYYENDIKESDKELLNFPLYSYLTEDYSFKNKLRLLFKWKIKNFDDSKYKITTENKEKIIFDKNSGFVLKVNDSKFDNVYINRYSNFEDLSLPNLNEYSVQY